MAVAEPSDLAEEVGKALEAVPPPTFRNRDRARKAARRTRALTLRLAGFTYDQIAADLGISRNGAYDLVNRTLRRAETHARTELIELENARLDRAQAAIWAQVLKGDTKAIDAFLKISNARRQMNQMNAPTQVEVAMSIRHEMQQALDELELLVLEDVRSDDSDSTD